MAPSFFLFFFFRVFGFCLTLVVGMAVYRLGGCLFLFFSFFYFFRSHGVGV